MRYYAVLCCAGNVLDPLALVDRYGAEYLRYYLASEIHFGNDGDFSHEAFCARINAELADDLGNLAMRALTFTARHCAGAVPKPQPQHLLTEADQALLGAAAEALTQCRGLMQQQSVKTSCEVIIQLAKMGNKYIDTQAPWVLVKKDRARMETVLYVLLELLRGAAILLSPVCPRSCDHMLDQLGVAREHRNFEHITAQPLKPGSPINRPVPVFPKIEPPPPASSTTSAAAATKDTSAAQYPQYSNVTSAADLGSCIIALGDKIRQFKAASKAANKAASKAELKPLIEELTFLKNRYDILF